jgi:hypothetical protein
MKYRIQHYAADRKLINRKPDLQRRTGFNVFAADRNQLTGNRIYNTVP